MDLVNDESAVQFLQERENLYRWPQCDCVWGSRGGTVENYLNNV